MSLADVNKPWPVEYGVEFMLIVSGKGHLPLLLTLRVETWYICKVVMYVRCVLPHHATRLVFRHFRVLRLLTTYG